MEASTGAAPLEGKQPKSVQLDGSMAGSPVADLSACRDPAEGASRHKQGPHISRRGDKMLSVEDLGKVLVGRAPLAPRTLAPNLEGRNSLAGSSCCYRAERMKPPALLFKGVV